MCASRPPQFCCLLQNFGVSFTRRPPSPTPLLALGGCGSGHCRGKLLPSERLLMTACQLCGCPLQRMLLIHQAFPMLLRLI